ncbi:cytochrome P450 family 87 subfamily A polypeptide 2 [Citrus sinensis]|uniref:Cytochrome P450 family 87 subfamily A polypeptide 2 n=1 Tax=Citrus sinensis TaxID=2711 RepID=A0ACB8MC97_CITSI|nr:cytochrome P450 family 87 subfamily A polypeptide 2 [Citrus sinensis]
MYVAAVLLVTLLVVKISHWVYTWANPKCNGKLPPGSMGLPIIGETIQFFTPYSLYETQPFIKKRMARYGSVFRTNIAGQKVIVSTDPVTNYSIMNTENESLLFWCTDGLSHIFGNQNFLSQHGSVHKYLRSLVLHLTGREILRQKFLHEIDQTTRSHLHSWASSPGTVNVRDACAEGRKHIRKVIEDIYQERKATKVPGHDFLDRVLEEVEKENAVLNDSNAIDLLFVLLFAAFETVSQSITLITKHLTDHPQVLAELTEEHEGIISRREDENSEVTWEEYKSMTFTHMVINEIVRLANIIPVTFRKVLKDMELDGKLTIKYTHTHIRWVIMMVLPLVHFDADKYEDPLAFNPWRWKGKELHTGTKTFMGFGGGVRPCAGADFAKVHLAVYIHYLVTKYRWSVVKGGEVFKQPALKFPNGLHVKIAEKHKI